MCGSLAHKGVSPIRRKEFLFGYLFVAPALLCIIVFVFYPIIQSIFLSMFDYDVVSKKVFVGFGNFSSMWNDRKWLSALRITVYYVVMFVPSMLLISLGLALIIKHIGRFSGFFRTTFFMPIIVSSTAAGAVFKLVFNQKTGAINVLVRMLGGTNINFLGNPTNALICCVFLAIWLGMGYNMIIFLAGLQDIPRDYYEAAAVDGANGWQQFWNITVPGLKHTSIFVFTMSIINAFQTFDGIKMLTNGGPNDKTQVAVMWIYENAFIHYRMGYACALSLILFVIIMVITSVQLKLTQGKTD